MHPDRHDPPLKLLLSRCDDPTPHHTRQSCPRSDLQTRSNAWFQSLLEDQRCECTQEFAPVMRPNSETHKETRGRYPNAEKKPKLKSHNIGQRNNRRKPSGRNTHDSQVQYVLLHAHQTPLLGIISAFSCRLYSAHNKR